ncbi:hypothetical protein DFH09DRAFT_1144394 [Mycena vulgaris]|nr:hypothetical protein DFH09DRAFT_1144394 [Mycena vulgaris]
MADTAFSTAWTYMLQQVCKSAIALFLGGLYFMLALVAFRSFYRRNTRGRDVFLCAIAVMLLLAITQMVVQLVLTALSMRLLYTAVQDLAADEISFSTQQASLLHLRSLIVLADDIILVTNNAIADGLFIYRCYIIWAPRYKQVVILPVLLLLITTALGYVTVYRNTVQSRSEIEDDPRAHMDSRVGFALAIITNLTLTGLTAGRIWWTRRQLDTLGQQKFSQRYTRAISVLMESGAAYSSIIILVIIALSVGRTATTGPTAVLASISYGAAGQLVNIVPTVFIIRVCLGRNENFGADSLQKPFSA